MVDAALVARLRGVPTTDEEIVSLLENTGRDLAVREIAAEINSSKQTARHEMVKLVDAGRVYKTRKVCHAVMYGVESTPLRPLPRAYSDELSFNEVVLDAFRHADCDLSPGEVADCIDEPEKKTSRAVKELVEAGRLCETRQLCHTTLYEIV